MAATVLIYELTSATAGTDKTSGTVRFKAADNQTVDTSDRLQIPTGATIYSYTKQLRVNVTVAPSVDIQNIRAYSDGANSYGTGIGVQYDVPGGGLGTFPNINTNISGTDFFTKTSVSTINLAAINTGPYTGTGFKGDVLRLQMSVANTAASGQLSPETLTIAYDET
jgi:hypothetical protein